MIIKNDKIILYETDNKKVVIDVYFEDETFWITQKAMSELFDVEVNTINYHIKEIYNTEELKESSTIRNFRIVQKEGNRNVTRELSFYSIDMIIAVRL